MALVDLSLQKLPDSRRLVGTCGPDTDRYQDQEQIPCRTCERRFYWMGWMPAFWNNQTR